MRDERLKRFLEIIPGALSWSILCFFVLLFIFRPFVAAVVMIIFLLYWVCRFFYMSLLLVLSHHRVATKRNIDWLAKCREVRSDLKFQDVLHVVLYTVYKEPDQVLQESLRALGESAYPLENVIVVLAGEERASKGQERLARFKEQFRGSFQDILVTIHPDHIPGEIPAKGANATYAAKQAKEHLLRQGVALERVILSCFDADTCPDKNYLACLTYNFLRNPKRHRTSFQPFPVYNNNIYTAPAFARVIEIGSTFWQLIESMKYEKFITFSSHSMSFKTLVEVGYWPVDLISDDSLIFWKCFLKYNGDYRTYPLEVPVFMDIAVGRNFLDTIRVQYRQKRRWAWGVENFIFVGMDISKKELSLFQKFKRLFQILDNHVNWATWAIIISIITPCMLLRGRMILKHSLVLFNLSYINSIIFNALVFILLLCMVMSYEFLPQRPRHISRFIYIIFALQWLLIPIISACLGSTPALDAQTRLMLGKYLYFYPTPKKRQSP
jgi:hypothetical protein